MGTGFSRECFVMNDHYPPIFSDATADEILAVLRDLHRQQCGYDPEAERDILLCKESTIAQWRNACNLLRWRKVAEAMNEYWRVTIPMVEWRDVLEPAKERRLGGVCELLASHAKLPRIRAARIFGSSCESAGAFLTIRSYLAEAGADVSGVAPSTLLDEYTRRYPRVFLGPVLRLAPGALPVVKFRSPVYHAFLGGMFLSLIGMVVAWCAGWILIATFAALLLFSSYFGVWIAARWMLPKSVEFGGLKTFRDLSKAIAS
jgi:hypothetical protein